MSLGDRLKKAFSLRKFDEDDFHVVTVYDASAVKKGYKGDKDFKKGALDDLTCDDIEYNEGENCLAGYIVDEVPDGSRGWIIRHRHHFFWKLWRCTGPWGKKFLKSAALNACMRKAGAPADWKTVVIDSVTVDLAACLRDWWQGCDEIRFDLEEIVSENNAAALNAFGLACKAVNDNKGNSGLCSRAGMVEEAEDQLLVEFQALRDDLAMVEEWGDGIDIDCDYDWELESDSRVGPSCANTSCDPEFGNALLDLKKGKRTAKAEKATKAKKS